MNAANQITEHQHPGAVKSLTHSSCLVAEPIRVVIEGKQTDLSRADAMLLRDGLAAAIQSVQAAESILTRDVDFSHLCVIGSTRSGMSMQRSKLRSKLDDEPSVRFFGSFG